MSAPASMNRQIPEAVVGLLVLALMTLAAPAPAAVIVWNNVGTAWSLDADWIGPHAPINDLTTDIADFNAASYFDCVYQALSCFFNGSKRLRFFQ